MPDSEWFDSVPLTADDARDWPAAGVGIMPWLDRDLLEGLRDRPEVVDPNSKRDGRPFVHEAGRFRSLHFSIFHLQSEMDVRRPLRLTVDYTRMMMGFLLFRPAPRHIEMVGLGGGSLAKYCHHTLPDADICVAEIDPGVIALRDRFCIPADSARFRVVQEDGADFVRRRDGRPDILLVDGFDRRGQPPQLCTAGFYRACRERLAPGGMMVVNLSGAHGEKAAITARIADVFAGRILGVATEGGCNRTIFAGKDEQPLLTPRALDDALERLRLDQGHFLASVGRRILREHRRCERRTRYERAISEGASLGGAGMLYNPCHKEPG